MYLCFVDLSAALDCVKYDKLFEVLEFISIDNANLCFISKLYQYQTVEARVRNNTADSVNIKKGVGQGCHYHLCSLMLTCG